MSRSQRSARNSRKKKKDSSAKSVIYILILIIAVAVLGWYFFYEFSFRTDYNTAVNKLDESFQSLDSKGIEDSMRKLEALRKSNLGNKER